MMNRACLILVLFAACVLLRLPVAEAGGIESSYRSARSIIDKALLRSHAQEWRQSRSPLLI